MTTATLSRTAPTEAEIREAIEERIPVLDPDAPNPFDHPDRIYDALDPVMDSDEAVTPTRRSPEGWADEFSPPADHPGTLWADMRSSEVDELHGAIEAVMHRALHDYLVTVREGVIAAAVKFAEAHPDIPRGTWRQ